MFETNHGGERKGAGRPPGAKNKPKYSPAGTIRVRGSDNVDGLIYGQVHDIIIGRPAIYENADELRKITNQYFIACDSVGASPTRYGYLDYLGISRQTYQRYYKKSEFSEILDQAFIKIVSMTEFGLLNDPSNTAGYTTMLKILDGGNGQTNNLSLGVEPEVERSLLDMTHEERLDHLK